MTDDDDIGLLSKDYGMLTSAIQALRAAKADARRHRDAFQNAFAEAARRADQAAIERDRCDRQLAEIEAGLTLLTNSAGLLEQAGQIPHDDLSVDDSINRELDRLLK